jgi:hypothetical protein
LGHLFTYKYSSTYRYKNMAATNDPNQVAEALARMNDDMQKFGYITEETARALQDAQTGVKNFGKKADEAAGLTVKAFSSVATTATEAAKAMHDGAKGNQAFNSSLDKMREGVEATGALLTAIIPGGPVIKALIAAITLATGKMIDLNKVAGKMSDDFFKGFQGLSKSGAAARDGMDELQAGMAKLGLGVQDMEGYVRLIGESSRDLALFKGSVFAGRKAFEDIGAGMKQYQYQLMAAGMTQEDIAKGTMSYLKLQTRLGYSQTQTTQQLAEGARKYLMEQDALTKLTGQTREETEKARQDAMQEEQFRAKLRQMELSGDKEGADRLRKYNDLMTAINPALGKGIRALSTGNLQAVEAQQLMMTSSGQAALDLQEVMKGTLPMARAADRTAKAIGQFSDAVGTNLGVLQANNGVFMDYAAQQDIRIAQEKGFEKTLAKIEQEKIAQGQEGGKAAGNLTDANIRLAQVQQQAMIDLQKGTGMMMLSATENSIKLATAAKDLAPVYDKLTIVMIKFNAMMGRVVDYILPKFIDSMNWLLDKMGLAMSDDPKQKQESGVYGAAGAATGGMIGSYAPGFWKALAVPLGTAIGYGIGNSYGRMQSGEAVRNLNLDDSELMLRAEGGPVNPNTPYIVGEKGPELFMPKNAGDIISTKQLLGSGQPAGMPEVDVEYKRIIKAIKDITVAVEQREKDTEAYTEHNKKYHLEMISLLNQDYNNTKTYMEAGGTPAAMSSGMGLQPGGGGLGMTAGGSLAGLKLKQGDVQAEGAALSPRLVQLAQAIQSNMPNFNYFSAFNDKFHQEKASSSSHTQGTALDFTLTKPPSPQEGQEIVRYLRSMGASLVIDEYNNPSSNATAGHIHAQIPGFADGGIAMDPTIAMVAEKGPEAMLPLTSDGFLGKLGSAMAAMVPQQQTMIGLLEDIRRSQAATAIASERMAQVAAN